LEGAIKSKTKRPPVSKGVLPELLGYNLRRAQVRLFQHFSETVGKHGITPGQFGVLAIIHANEGLKQIDLAAALGVDRSTVVAVVDRLEEVGWIRRAQVPTDRRSYALNMTDFGRDSFEELLKEVHSHERELTEGMTEGELDGLLNGLKFLARR